MVKVVLRGQSAAGHKGVCHADGRRIFEGNSDVIYIIFFEEGICKDAADVALVIFPILACEPGSDVFKLIGKTFAAADLKAAFQRRRNSVRVFVTVFPKERTARSLIAARVRYVKDVFDFGVIAGSVQKRNALGAAPHITAHLRIPKVIVCAGGGVRSLGKDHKLLVVRVLI